MGHYAKVRNGIVEQVIVAKKDFIDTLEPEEGVEWIKTSYNTYHGVHYKPNTERKIPDDKPPLRKNYAGLGSIYDRERDAFIHPQPYPSWILNEDTCDWDPPVAHPGDGNRYDWDEENQQWVLETDDT